MIRVRCKMVQRGWTIGACDDQSKMEETMVWQDGQNFRVVWMILRVRHDEGFWEEFCHLFLKNTIKPYVVLLPNFLVIIMILRNSSPSLCHLRAFFCYISMYSVFFFCICSPHKSSQCKHSQGHFATVQKWKLLPSHLWSGHQMYVLCFTMSSLYTTWRSSLLNGMRHSTFLFQHFTFSNNIFAGYYKVESKDKCLRALSADCEMNFPSPSPADVQHPEWWSDSINRAEISHSLSHN